MEKETVNSPYKSHWIGGMYISMTVLIALIYLIVYLFTELYQAPCFIKAIFSVVMIFGFLIMLITTTGFYTTKYKIKDGVLYSWSPFVVIKLKLKDIKNIEKIMVPFHIRVGASLYCGVFYVPNLGWVKSIITNLRDAILITTKKGKYYMITPSNPKKFMKLLK